MTTEDYATRLLISRVVRDKMAEGDKGLRENALSVFRRAGQRDIGVIPDGTDDGAQIGSVQLVKGAQKVRVYDQPAYMAWVEANHPDAITRAVPSSFTNSLMAEIRATGEVPPGVEIVSGEPYLNVKPSEDAAETIGQALADGRLSWQEVATAAIESQP